MIVMDSGLGGISVVRALRKARPRLPLVYVADTAGFPYGARGARDIAQRAAAIITHLTALREPGPVVLACNTLSTLCLASLRHKFPTIAFVGTVPAVKVAATHSRSRRFTLLATPNTASSDYTNELIGDFANDCVVDSYGAPDLALYAEQMLLGETIDANLIRQQITPAFVDDRLGKTDSIVLGCTHYPLIVDKLRAVAPWDVSWIDSSDAIARQALRHPDQSPAKSTAYVTADADIPRYRTLFAREGFEEFGALSFLPA